MVPHLPQMFIAEASRGARPRGRTGTARRATPLFPGKGRHARHWFHSRSSRSSPLFLRLSGDKTGIHPGSGPGQAFCLLPTARTPDSQKVVVEAGTGVQDRWLLGNQGRQTDRSDLPVPTRTRHSTEREQTIHRIGPAHRDQGAAGLVEHETVEGSACPGEAKRPPSCRRHASGVTGGAGAPRSFRDQG